MKHMKNYKHFNLHGKGQSTVANTEITKMTELPKKDFKSAIIKMLKQAIINTFETNAKNRKPKQRNTEIKEELNLNFKTENYNKNKNKSP